MVRQGDVLTLDDNRDYSVVYTTEVQSKNYVYLIDQDDYTNTMFCEYDNKNDLKEVTDIEIIEQLMEKFK